MYSLILMTAMSAAPDTTEFNGFFRDLFSFRGGCHGSCTGCYGSCTGRSSGGYGSCTGSCTGSGSGCYGNGRLRAFNNNACYGSCTGRTAAGVGSCTGYAASCTGTPSYSCQGSAPMSGMSDGYAVPSPAMSQYPVMDGGSCIGASGGSGIPMPVYGPSYDNGGYIPATPMPAVPQSYNSPPDSVPEQRNSLRAFQGQANRATVVVRLPADARLFAENRPLALTSGERQFVTPPLPEGEFTYTFRAEYVRNGETISQTKRVNVRSGNTYPVEFNDLTNAKNSVPPSVLPPAVTGPLPYSTDFAAKPTASVKPLTVPAPTAPTERAKITVKLPAGATLFVDGKKNDRTELVREFNTPPLPPGQDYAYIMKAEMMRGGQPESQTIKVTFRAGEITPVDFTNWPTSPSSPPSPRTIVRGL